MTRMEGRRTDEGVEDRNEELQEEDRREVEWLQPYGDERERTGTGEDITVRLATMNINSYPNAGTTKAMRLIEETRHLDCLVPTRGGMSHMAHSHHYLAFFVRGISTGIPV